MPLPGRRGAMDAQWTRTPFHPLTFTPDLDPATPGGIADAQGLYPTAKGLRTLPTLLLRANGINEPTQGWFSAVFPTGAINLYAGTAHHLWSAATSQFQEADNGQTFAGGSNFWTFAQIASTVIATNGVDPVQAVTTPGGQFTALGGSPPIAKIASSADPGGTGFFAFLFNLAADPQGWACSGAGLPNSWPLDTTNLSAKGTLGLTQGPVTAATPLRGGVCAFKNTSFYYGQFIGTPFIWQFGLISPSQGVAGPYAIANAGDSIYFIGVDNIYAFDGYSLNPVPNALSEWLIRTMLDRNHANKIIGQYDATNDLIIFRFPSINANPAGTLDMKIMWNRRSGRWCVDHEVAQGGFQTNLQTTTGTSYQQVTTTFPTYASILTGVTYAILAPAGSTTTVTSVFLPDNNLYTYSGPPRKTNTFFITNDIGRIERLTSIYRCYMSFTLHPDGQLMIGHKAFGRGTDIQGAPPDILSGPVNAGPSGFMDLRQTSRWNSIQFLMDGDTEVSGWGVMTADGGGR